VNVPAAVPDLSLIERSQFFRLDGARVLDVEASRALTGWWAFTILAIVTYGLLPRLALWSLCVARLRAATRALLLEDPRVTALLDRMAARLEARPEILNKRRETVEHPFGSIKQWMNQGAFLTRRLDKVRAEFSLTALAYNLRRALNILGVNAMMAAVRV
jgi:hypothetical protein